MITVTFPCYTEFGKGDYTDWEITVNISEEDYDRLRKAAKRGDSFAEAEDVSDIYDTVYEAVVEASTEDFKENDPEMVEDYLDEGESFEEWQANEVFGLGVNFPEEWEKE